jgi:NAD(P)-dependent dehydrogenase (short-subunit alcohol dehydrogenase family)
VPEIRGRPIIGLIYSTGENLPMLLENRAALVTGGAGRLGATIAEILHREGARVAIADLNADGARSTAERIGAAGEATAWVSGDTSNPDDAGRMFTEADQAVGPIDILVNCAGIFPNCPLLDVSVEEWDQVFAINVRGSMLMCQAAGRKWAAAQTRGAIINVSSGAATSPRSGGAHYTGSKAALNMLTQVLAIELGPLGIRVNAVAPGLVLDEVLTQESDDQHPYVNLMLRGTPLARTGSPRDVGEAVAFLASDRSAWTTGAILDITGGSHCGRTHVPNTVDMKI